MHYMAPPPPSDDRRWRMVTATMRRLGNRPDALIETLHAVQDAFGHLEPEALRWVGRSLRVPPSRVLGVATFYHFFRTEPQGEHSCILCTGTACYIKGVPQIVEAIRQRFGVGEGETTPDGRLTVLGARCLGSCGQAPIAVMDGEMVGNLTPEAALERIEGMVARADH